MAQINTTEELDAYYHDSDVHTLNFPHISNTIRAILRGHNVDRLLPLFLSTIPLITNHNISGLMTTLLNTPHFQFNSLNIHGILESIQDEPDYYELSPDVKQRLVQHFVSVLPLDTLDRIDEFMDSSDVSIDPIYHTHIVRNISEHGEALLAHYLFKKGVILHDINGYVGEFLRTVDFDNMDAFGKRTHLLIVEEMLEDPLLSPENRERLNMFKGAHVGHLKRKKRTLRNRRKRTRRV